MLDPNVLLRVRIRPARDIAGRVDSGDAGFEKLINGDAAVKLEACLLGQRQTRTHPNADNDDIALEGASVFERRALPIDGHDGIVEMKHDTMLLMQRMDEVAQFRPKHALHRSLLRSDHMNLDVTRT